MAGTKEAEVQVKAAANQPVVQFNDVRTKLGGRQILDGLTFDVRKGETFVIIGYSGTGKSVTLRHLVGLMHPDSGSIRVDSDEITTMSQRELGDMRRKFGVLFQSGALIAWLTVFENVELPLIEHTKFSRKKRAEIVEQKLKLVNLWADKDKYSSEISGGMKKRAGLARAIALDAQIVLYDEPASGLDPVMANEIDKLINALRDQLGVTSIVVTHDMESAYFIADRIGMFYKGKMIQIGTPDEIRISTIPEVRHFITGGKEGELSVRSNAAVATGRAPGLEHPSLRMPEQREKASVGESTIMNGFVLMDEVPPERAPAETGQTTLIGIPRDAFVRGEEPVEEDFPDASAVGEDSSAVVIEETESGEVVDLPGSDEETPTSTQSGRLIIDEEDRDDSSIAIPGDKALIEPVALEPEPPLAAPPKPKIQDLSPEQPEELK